MYTGADKTLKTGMIHSWNHATSTNYEDTCGQIRGSAGGFFPPNKLESSDTLELFAPDLCRTLIYQSTQNATKHHNLEGINYKLPISTFANATFNPQNWCFANNLPTGLQNASYCKAKKSPFLYSFPHFYGADPFYLDQFDSKSDLKPKEDLHSSSMLIEPVSLPSSEHLVHKITQPLYVF